MAKKKGKAFNMQKAGGMAAGLWAGSKLAEQDFLTNLDIDERLLNAGYVFLGDWLPKQKFMVNGINNPDLRDGLGTGLMALGILGLMDEFNISGVGQSRKLRDDDILAVAIEGQDDEMYTDYDDSDIDEDILAEDDDLDTINDDDDLDTINDDDHMDGFDDEDELDEDILG